MRGQFDHSFRKAEPMPTPAPTAPTLLADNFDAGSYVRRDACRARIQSASKQQPLRCSSAARSATAKLAVEGNTITKETSVDQRPDGLHLGLLAAVRRHGPSHSDCSSIGGPVFADFAVGVCELVLNDTAGLQFTWSG